MKTFKKTLCLVLALVMIVGTLAMGASADFKDSDKVTYKEAVDVLVGIGTINGDENGYVNPTAKLDRASAAKIVAYLVKGKTAADSYSKADTFKDVSRTHWASSYINWAVGQSYLAGDGTGNFLPSGALTGHAWAKMLLCALGYNAKAEGYLGDDWKNNVEEDANAAGIVDDIDNFDFNAEVDRETACQMAFNTLKATMVKYTDNGVTIVGKDITITTSATKEDVANSKAKDYRGESDPDADEFMQFCEKYYEDLKLAQDDTDAFGRDGHTWTYDGDNIGTYGDEADYVLVAEKDTTLAELVEDNNLDKKITSYYSSAINSEGETIVDCGTVVELWVENKEAVKMVTYYYTIVKVDEVDEYESDDEMAEDYGASVEYTLKDLDDMAFDAKIWVDGLSEDNTGYQAIGAFDEGDVLVVTMNSSDEAQAFAEADVFNGKVSGKGTNYVKVDGEKYAAVSDVSENVNFDDTFTFYANPNGIIIAMETYEEADTAMNYAYVLAAEGSTESESILDAGKNEAKVKLLFTDGTIEVVDYAITKTSDKKYDSGYYFTYKGDKYDLSAFGNIIEKGDTYKLTVNEWVAYTTNDDGAVTLKSADKDKVSKVENNISAVKDIKTLKSGLYASSSTVVTVFDEDGKATTYKGYANFPSSGLTDKAALIIYGSGTDAAKEVYIYDAAYAAEAETIDVALFVSIGDETSDGTIVNFVVDGKAQELTVASGDIEKAPLSSAKAGKLFKIEIDDEDIATVESITSEFEKKDKITVVSDDYIVLESANEIDLADDCAVYEVSKDGKKVSSGTLAADKDAIVILNSDSEATQIFIYRDISILN